jgi:MFS family permease
VIQLLVVGAAFARLVFVPLQLESLRGFSALRVGTMFIAPAISTAIGMNLGGRMVDRFGPRRPIMAGCAAMFVSLALCARFTLDTPIWLFVTLLCAQGFGMGLTAAPGMVAGIHDLPERLFPQASAVRSLTGQLAGALAVAVFGTIVATVMGDDPTPAHAQEAYNSAFLAASLGMIVALMLATRLPSQPISAAAPPEALLAIE